MQKRIRLALIACAIGACAGAASAEAPAKPVWSVSVEPDEGFRLGFIGALAVHADAALTMPIWRSPARNRRLAKRKKPSVAIAWRDQSTSRHKFHATIIGR
jgi:hypothetical protein